MLTITSPIHMILSFGIQHYLLGEA